MAPFPDATEKKWVTIRSTLPPIPYVDSHSNIVLETPRLVLRPLAETDLEALYVLQTQPEVVKWRSTERPDASIDVTREDLLKRLANQESIDFAICVKQTNDVIGVGGTHRRKGNLGFPVIGYTFRFEAWGKGYATEFVEAFLKFWWTLPREEVELEVDESMVEGEGDLKREFINSVVIEKNIASQRVMEKAGAVARKFWREQDLAHPEAQIGLIAYAAQRPE